MNTQRIQNRKSEIPNQIVEEKAEKIPNLVFLVLAGASIAGSLLLAAKAKRKTDFANFVAHWAPTLLLFGVYNKIVKVEDELLQERSLH